MKIAVGLSDWRNVGGASLFFRRLFKALPEYEWIELREKDELNADLLIYGNLHEFYLKARAKGIPAILRTQGVRSFSLPQPDDLHAVICSSMKAYALSNNPKRQMIYNGVDKAWLDRIDKKTCEWLTCDARIGKGQHPEAAINYATSIGWKTLTMLGTGIAGDNTYSYLSELYKNVVKFPGLVSEEQSYAYIKGCGELWVTNPSHGLSNAVCVARYFKKPVLCLTDGVEIPDVIPDIKETAAAYKKIIEGLK